MKILVYCVCVGFIIIVGLGRCGSPLTQTTPEASSSRVAATQVQPTAIPIARPTALQVALPSTLSAGWTTLAWQNLVVPLPPTAQWQILSTYAVTDSIAPIVAKGAVTYPPKGEEIVEQPFGPVFTIYTFSDSLEAWIQWQQQRGTLAVEAATLADITLATQPAKRYQPVVTGLCNTGYYIIKVDTDHLLEVMTECIDAEPYMTIIKQLSLQKP